MSLCKDDIVLFSDDDIVYKDGYNDAIVNAFNEIPKADIIILGIDYEKDGVIYKRKGHKKIKRLHVWNSLKYGAAVFAVKRDALVKNRLCFSTIFGGGCIYSNGEDSLFLIDCIKKGLKVYAYPYILGVTRKNESSWFEGYNEKFFYDKGAWIACAFPMIKNIIKWYFVYRLKPLSNISTKRCLRLMNNGIKGFRTLKGYKEEVVSSENINN